jgi:hypothetical protein
MENKKEITCKRKGCNSRETIHIKKQMEYMREDLYYKNKKTKNLEYRKKTKFKETRKLSLKYQAIRNI